MLQKVFLIIVCLETIWCQDCSKANYYCSSCYYPSIGNLQCTACHWGAVYNPGNHNCIRCNFKVENCLVCHLSGECLRCDIGYGLISNGANQYCQPCNFLNCFTCNISPTQCDLCEPNYGKSLEPNKCKECELSNCDRCYENNSECSHCRENYGVDIAAMECRKCNESECISCGWDYLKCEKCSENKGPNKDGLCVPCNETSTCLKCSLNYTVCEECVERTALHVPYCFYCDDPDCSNCSNVKTKCIECDSGKNIGVDSTFGCSECSTNCSTCSTKDNKHCLTCIDGYFVNNKICSPCTYNMPECLSCISIDHCTKCSVNYFVNATTHKCDDICGDEITLKNACDLPLGIELDGCTDQCEIEENFDCHIDNYKTFCWYVEKLNVSITSMKKDAFENKAKIKFTILPLLHAFKFTDISTFVSIYPLSFKILTFQFDYKTGNAEISVSFNESLINKELKIVFTPDNNNIKYLKTPESETSLKIGELNYYSDSYRKYGRALSILFTTAVVLGWIGIVVGIIAKTLAGIETFVVFQIALAVLIWIKIPLYEPLQGGINLQYLIFYVKQPFFPSDKTPVSSPLPSNFVFYDKLEQVPHFEKFNFESHSFSNNFNIALAFQIIPLISLLILAAIVSISRKRLIKMRLEEGQSYKDKPSEESDSYKLQVKLVRMEKAKEISATLLMCFSTLNVLGFASALFLFFNYSAPPFNLNELIIISISAAVFILTIILFFFDSDPFDYFRYSFKKQELALLQYVFFLIVFISTLVMIFMFPEISWASMVPFSTLLVYTILYRPYIETRENIRSVIVDLIVLLVLGFRVYTQYFPEHMNNQYTYIYILIIAILFIFLGILTIAYLIYRIIYFWHILPKIEKEDHEEILLELETIKIKEKMKYSKNVDGVFNKILRREMNILDFSKEMKNLMIENNLEVNNLSQKRTINTVENNEGKKFRKEMNEKERLKNDVSNSECPKEYLLGYQKERENIEENIKNNFEDYKIYLEANKEHLQNENEEINLKEKNVKNYILSLMAEENKFINIKNAEQHYIENKTDKDIDNHLFLEQYEKIE